MGIRVDTEKVMLWDSDVSKMVVKTAVTVSLVGNKGSVYACKGPIFCADSAEIFEASQTLRARLTSHLDLEQGDRII